MNPNWLTVTASDFCSQVTDGTHDTPKPCQRGKPLITSKHIKGSTIDFDSAYQISNEDFNEINRRSKVDQWDVIISMIGAYCGYCFVERAEHPDYAVKNVGLFKAGSKVKAEWLYYFLKSPLGKARLDQTRGGSSQPYLPLGGIRALAISSPSDPAALDRIVAVLSDIDAKIELNQRINAELEALAKTIYDYWFVQFDFPDENGRPYKSSGGVMEWSDSLNKVIPAGWKAAELSDLVLVGTATMSPQDEPDQLFRHVSIPSFDKNSSYILEHGREIRSNKFKVAKNDLLVSKLNPWTNRVVADTDHGNLICSTEFLVWQCGNPLNQAFLQMIATHPHFVAYCSQSAAGTSNSHRRVNPGVMMQYRVAYSNGMLEAFGDLATSMLQKRIAGHQENRELTELRDWLLPMLMNGQVRVA